MEQVIIQNEVRRLSQADRIDLIEHPTTNSFVCVYTPPVTAGVSVFSYLLPLKHDKRFLKTVAWDHRYGDFQAHVECETGFSDRKVYYLPHGTQDGSEPLVHLRSFGHFRPVAIEIAEEFRLFHNLYYEKSRDTFLHFDLNGIEHEVIRVAPNGVFIKLNFLTDFLRAKQMHLAIQREGNTDSPHSLEILGLSPIAKTNRGDDFHWEIWLANSRGLDESKCSSRLLGKSLIRCPGPIEYHSPYDEESSAFQSFVVGHDAKGGDILGTCNPESIRGDANRALQPVFFNRAVLGKYFEEPEKFSVEDGRLRCGGHWILRMDNDHPKYVIAFLVDIGDLPCSERNHWRNHNVQPDGGVSKTFFRRNIRGSFADAQMPDLKLKRLYRNVSELWNKHQGWPLWREPAEQDRYVFNQVHVCLQNNQTEFDQQNGLLAKLLVDSLNEGEIEQRLKTKPPTGARGLTKLEQFLTETGHADAKSRIKPLRLVQELRSTGSAHRKSSSYHRTIKEAGLTNLPLVEASMRVFEQVAELLHWLKVGMTKTTEQS